MRRKGFKHSEETKRKIGLANSIALKGKHLSEEHRKKVIKTLIKAPFTGHIHSEKTKRKMSESHKKVVMNDEWCKKISLSKLGSKNPMFGKKISEKTREKMRKAYDPSKLRPPSMLGKYHSEITKKKISNARLKQILPFRDSKPELMMQLALQLEDVPFIKHKAILGQPDIFIEPNICLFVDGCYFHYCQKCFKNVSLVRGQLSKIMRDYMVNHRLTVDGYVVIRIWEHDIVNADSRVKRNVVNMIKQLMLRTI